MAKGKKLETAVGLAISEHHIEALVFDPQTFLPLEAMTVPIPPGVLGLGGDTVLDPEALGRLMAQALKPLKMPAKQVFLSVPGSLLRLVEMPRLEEEELYLSLSSEAERYKLFDGTEAAVAFGTMPQEPGGRLQKLTFGAVRRDTLEYYLRALQIAKVKPLVVDLEPLNVLRAMAGAGVLDSLVQQIGPEAYWAMLFVEAERVRISIWQANRLLELREVQMETTGFAQAGSGSVLVDEVVEEVRRTARNRAPVILLTHRLSGAMPALLEEMLGIPVRPATLPPTLGLDQADLSNGEMMAVVGAAMRPVVPFPFSFNLLAARRTAYAMPGSPPRPAGAVEEVGIDMSAAAPGMGSLGDLLSGGGGASPRSASAAEYGVEGGSPLFGFRPLISSAVVVGVLWVALFIGGMVLAEQAGRKEKEKLQVQGSVAMLNHRRDELKERIDAQSQLAKIATDAKIRNLVFVNLSQDLQRKTPPKLWINHLDVGSDVNIMGKSLAHQSVIELAKNFDGAPYVSGVLINSIKEDFVGRTSVFNFKLSGQVRLNPNLLQQMDESKTAVTPSKAIPSAPPGIVPTPATSTVPKPTPKTPLKLNVPSDGSKKPSGKRGV